MRSNIFRVMVIAVMASFSIILFSCKKDDPGLNEVFIDNNAFTPASITIDMGTTVTWTNKEDDTHTVTSDGALFDSGNMQVNDTYSRTFGTVGTFPYHCEQHPEMHGTVIVE